MCEGKTESSLLKALRGHLRIASLLVEIVGEAGVPKTVVRRAKERRRELGRDAEVWVVFDRDEHPCWSDAIRDASAVGIRLAVSNPCIELFGLLLHREQTAALERGVAQSALKKEHRGYCHNRRPYFDLDVVCEARERAAERADVLRRRAMEAGDPYRNPTTTFVDLIERLWALRSDH